jgi:phytoene/squalene synthetase
VQDDVPEASSDSSRIRLPREVDGRARRRARGDNACRHDEKLAAVALVLAFAALALSWPRVFLIGFSVVPQNAARPFLRARTYSREASVRSRRCQRDIVPFHRVQEGRRYLYVWRVVGVPGDTVRPSNPLT